MKVERDGELVLVREVVVEVTEEAEVEHEAHYVLTKFGSQEVKLDCTDFTENSHNWTRAGQQTETEVIRLKRNYSQRLLKEVSVPTRI